MKVLLGILAVPVLVAAIWLLRETTMDKELPTVPGSRYELVLEPRTRDPEAYEGQAFDQAAELLALCSGYVDASVVENSVRRLSEAQMQATVRPAPRGANQAELRGCLEDIRVKWLLVDVVSTRVIDARDREIAEEQEKPVEGR